MAAQHLWSWKEELRRSNRKRCRVTEVNAASHRCFIREVREKRRTIEEDISFTLAKLNVILISKTRLTAGGKQMVHDFELPSTEMLLKFHTSDKLSFNSTGQSGVFSSKWAKWVFGSWPPRRPVAPCSVSKYLIQNGLFKLNFALRWSGSHP